MQHIINSFYIPSAVEDSFAVCMSSHGQEVFRPPHYRLLPLCHRANILFYITPEKTGRPISVSQRSLRCYFSVHISTNEHIFIPLISLCGESEQYLFFSLPRRMVCILRPRLRYLPLYSLLHTR